MCAVEEMAIRKSKPKREKKLLNVSPADTPSASELFAQPPVEITEETPARASVISQSAKTAGKCPCAVIPQTENRPASVQKSNLVLTQRVLIVGITISGRISYLFTCLFPPPAPHLPPMHTFPRNKLPPEAIVPSPQLLESNWLPSTSTNKEADITQPQVAQKEAK